MLIKESLISQMQVVFVLMGLSVLSAIPVVAAETGVTKSAVGREVAVKTGVTATGVPAAATGPLEPPSSDAPVLKTAKPKSSHRWAPLTTGDYLWLGGFLGGTIAVGQMSAGPFGNWQGGILFDDAIRNGFKGNSLAAREQAASLSDIGLISILTLPLVVNAGILSGMKYSDLNGAGRIAIVTLQSYAFALFTQRLIANVADRSRPAQLECSQNNPGYYPDCSSGDAFKSFFSGHTAMSFTAAGLVCRHNESLNLISDPLAQGLVCGGSLALAGGIGALRMVADRHYFSDVLIGGLVGFFSGYTLPLLLHRPEGVEAEDKVKVSLLPALGGDTTFQVSYSF